jgi:predicted chitinase
LELPPRNSEGRKINFTRAYEKYPNKRDECVKECIYIIKRNQDKFKDRMKVLECLLKTKNITEKSNIIENSKNITEKINNMNNGTEETLAKIQKANSTDVLDNLLKFGICGM